MLRSLFAATALLLVTACGADPAPAPASDATTTSAPEAAAAPASPDPTTAGGLDETSLPRSWLGFEAAVVKPEEGEFNPNGSWVHGQDPFLIATEAVPHCSDGPVPELPYPTAALTGTYRNADDLPGNGVAMEFATTEEASAWFTGYVAAVTSCAGVTGGLFEILDLDSSDTLLVDVRSYAGEIHSERAEVDGTVVRLLMAQTRETLDNLRVSP